MLPERIYVSELFVADKRGGYNEQIRAPVLFELVRGGLGNLF